MPNQVPVPPAFMVNLCLWNPGFTGQYRGHSVGEDIQEKKVNTQQNRWLQTAISTMATMCTITPCRFKLHECYSSFWNLGRQRFQKKKIVFSKSAITLSILIGLL